jgi:co-chaperonin GroES (HSP10)
VGNKVLFSSYSGTEVKESDPGKDEELLLISEDDIPGILNA